MCCVVCCFGMGGRRRPLSLLDSKVSPTEVIAIELKPATHATTTGARSLASLDFCIRGGAEHGIPVVVSSVEQGGAACAAGLQIGHEILLINSSVDVSTATHHEAVQALTEEAAKSTQLRRQPPVISLAVRMNHILRGESVFVWCVWGWGGDGCLRTANLCCSL